MLRKSRCVLIFCIFPSTLVSPCCNSLIAFNLQSGEVLDGMEHGRTDLNPSKPSEHPSTPSQGEKLSKLLKWELRWVQGQTLESTTGSFIKLRVKFPKQTNVSTLDLRKTKNTDGVDAHKV